MDEIFDTSMARSFEYEKEDIDSDDNLPTDKEIENM